MKRYEYNYGKNPEGVLSTISGYATETTNFGETAFGILNKSTRDEKKFTTPEVVSSSTATLFSVGNGTDTDNRKNIIELKADGTVFISGIGGYDGTNPDNSKDLSKELQSVHDDIDNINLDIDRIDSDIDSIHVEQNSDLVYTFIVKGENRGTINIPRDQFLKNVEYHEDTNILEFLFIIRNEENEEEQKVVEINMTDLEDIYTNGDGLNLENKKFSIKIDADTQPYIDVTSNGLKIIGVNEALDTKVDWQENKTSIFLPANGSITALRNDGQGGGVLICQRSYDDEATYVTEVGTTKNNLTLNSIERPKIDFADGSSQNVAYESEVKSLQDRMSTAETDIDNLEGRMDTAESDIDTIQSDLSELMGDGEGSVQDQIKTALEDYLPLSGGTMTGNITFGSEDYTGGIIISGKSDTDLVNAVGGTTTIDRIREGLATEDALNEYKTSNDEKIQSIEDKLDQEIEAGNTDKETIDNYTVNGHKISENPVLTKTDVGLNQVDNVQQIPMSMKGQAGGVAELDANGKVPSSQLNGQLAHVFGVDGVVANQTALPTEGVIVGDIYYTTENPNFYNYNGTSWDAPMAPKEDTIYNFRNSDATGDTSRTNILYRWDGATLVEISESLALGEVAGTAYEGNKGAANKAAIGTNTYTGANYISKETNLTDAVLQLDEEIKATNDNLDLEHANAEATYAKKTELDGYLPLTGGILTGTTEIHKDDFQLCLFGGVDGITQYNENNNIIFTLQPSDNGSGCLTVRDKDNSDIRTAITKSGVTISGKTTSDLLHASGGTISIDDLASQMNFWKLNSPITTAYDSNYSLSIFTYARSWVGSAQSYKDIHLISPHSNGSNAYPLFGLTNQDTDFVVSGTVTDLIKSEYVTPKTLEGDYYGQSSVYLIQGIEYEDEDGKLSGATGLYLGIRGDKNYYAITKSYAIKYGVSGITIHGKTSSDLLHAAGGTVSISEIGTQLGESTLATKDELADYLTKTDASNTYQPKGNYLTTIPSEYVTDSELNAKGYQTEAQVAAKVASLVDSAPETLNTLNELAAALGDDPNFATTVTNQIAQKADKTTATIFTDGLMPAADKAKVDHFAIQDGHIAVPDLLVTTPPDSIPCINISANINLGSNRLFGKIDISNDEELVDGVFENGGAISVHDRYKSSYVNIGNRFISFAGTYGGSGGIYIKGKTSSDLLHAAGGTTTLKTINGESLLGSGDITTPTPTVNAASGTRTIWTGTQSEYEDVTTKDANTLYFITEG